VQGSLSAQKLLPAESDSCLCRIFEVVKAELWWMGKLFLNWDVSVTDAMDARVRGTTVMVERASIQIRSVMVKPSSGRKGAAKTDIEKTALKIRIHFARRVI
jgi:hypothetical protein